MKGARVLKPLFNGCPMVDGAAYVAGG